MDYYLKTYLGGCDVFAAYDRFGMDKVIYTAPQPIYAPKDLDNWRDERKELGTDADGNARWTGSITTPEGVLTHQGARNAFTAWETEFLIKSQRDFELFAKYAPMPVRLDPTPVLEAQARLAGQGILRSWAAGFGQGSPWQDFCTLVDTEKAIYWAMDEPEFVHHAMQAILEKRLRYVAMLEGLPLDVIECGGGAGSNTVISPKLFREFLLPYDKVQHAALHAVGMRVVYHLCGGLMQMLELVVEGGADGLETMTPPAMGGDCNLAEAYRRVGDKLFFIGGFDQNAGFERGTPEAARQQVFALHAACPNGGYICCPSDHFFFGDPRNLQAFADAAKECTYA
ncbi:MAG: uroporphyrinogen decarboxylase family protein [Anaerolineae bacterium]